MKFIADFHLHSKYSRATSSQADLENLDRWAKIKGIKVLGTGDFTHPEWQRELKEKLEPAEPGLYRLKSGIRSPKSEIDSKFQILNSKNETRFILTSEISCIYTKNTKVRKIHFVVFAPDFETVEKISTQLGWSGNLRADGRPILGMDSKELLKIVLDSSPDCLFVPAHCLLPDTYLHSNPGIKKIKDISVGDKVYTHHGRLKKVKQIYTRFYKGPIYNIKPYNFRMGLQTTIEHPFYVIKTRWCPNMGHTICKKDCAYIKRRNCAHKYFKNYQPQWVQAKDIEKGDVLIFPRFNRKIKDVKEIKLSKYLSKKQFEVFGDKIRCRQGRTDKKLNNTIKIDKEFCRLAGYYVSEGYTDSRDSISFCFNQNEKRYVKDLKFLMGKVFNLSSSRIYKRKNANGVEIIYFSKILAKFFSKLFYNDLTIRKAHTKCLPSYMLDLPLEKQVEILRGWWRGDGGVTSSRELMNQMKIILLRLGIVPSIYEQTKEVFNKRYAHLYKRENRVIKAQHCSFVFGQLSFFEDLFSLLKTSEFKRFKTKLNRKHGWIDKKYIYLPVRDIEVKNYKGEVYNLEVEGDNSYLSEFATVHNCMTPWFGIFGSKSGFDSLEECFEEMTPQIFAVETGLSADPKMLWRLSKLDDITLISNSDAHSPQKIGREANIFEGNELSYKAIVEAIKKGGRSDKQDPLRLVSTIEFFPEEGKYHYDGHRLCKVRLSPEERKKYGGICPNCGKPLTIGVLSRVDALADREEGAKSPNAIPFLSLTPLVEIIGEAFSQGSSSKVVLEEYQKLINTFGSEFEILIEIPVEEIAKISPKVAEGIRIVREGKVKLIPGYDGEFGRVLVFNGGEEKKQPKQETLF